MGGRGSGYSKSAPAATVLPSRVRWKRSEGLVGAGLSDVERSIKGNKSESAAVYIKGQQILFKDGSRNYVDFSPKEVAAMKGAVLTHNHPGGGSFSDADVTMINGYGLKEIRAVSTGYTYSLSGKGKGLSKAEVRSIYKNESMKVVQAFRQKIKAGEMTVDEANKNHAHEIMNGISEKLGFIYKRTKT